MSRVLLIWNPVSTEVTAETVGAVLVRLAEQVEVVSMHTRGPGDAVRLGELAVQQGFEAVFVLGGDGTANEVVNGVGDRLPIGVLPAGGTSVLPRALGLPVKLEEATDRLCEALEEGSIALGGYYVGHTLKRAGNVYGTFGLVIGLLSWIYLSAHITLLAAEGNVVATRRLWPRSFSLMIEQPATQADKRAFTQRGKVEERRQDQTVSIDFPAAEQTETPPADAGSSDADQRPSASRAGAKLAVPTRTDASEEATRMAYHQDIGEWHGKTLVDRDGERIGKLEDVYVDVETNEPMFGTVKEGLIGRHLTFVPLAGITIGPDNLQVTVSKKQIESAPNIELHGDELSRSEESTLYHHYQLNYTPPETERGRRLARR